LVARAVKDHRLETRAARLRLPPSKQPYWREISQGAHVGYFRGKRVGKWVARFRALRSNGKYVQTTIGVADDIEDADGTSVLDFRSAQEIARTWFDEVARGVTHRTERFTVSLALDEYMRAFAGKSVASTRAKVDAIVGPGLGHKIVAELTTAEISSWHRELAAAPAMIRTSPRALTRNVRVAADPEAVRRRKSTANRYLTVLKAALNHAYREGRVNADEAWRRVRPFQNVDAAKYRYLTDEEARRLVLACEPAFRPMVQAALMTGARYSDLRNLKVRDLDARAGTLLLPNPKGGRAYVVYLAEDAARFFCGAAIGKSGSDLLFPRPDGEPWGVSHQRRRLEDASAKAGIERATFHDLRRTYGARLARQGVPLAVIAEAMGQADERITKRHYAHLAPSYVGDMIRKHMLGLDLPETGTLVPFPARASRQ
jgi:integrase